MENCQELLWSTGYYRISGKDDILKISVYYTLWCFAIFFLEHQRFVKLVARSFKFLSAEVDPDLEGGGIFRGLGKKLKEEAVQTTVLPATVTLTFLETKFMVAGLILAKLEDYKNFSIFSEL